MALHNYARKRCAIGFVCSEHRTGQNDKFSPPGWKVQWSFVGSKAQQQWLWYAYNTKTGGVLAYTFGPRNDETCRELLALLTPFSIGMMTSDDWGSYAREVPKEKHLTGKIFTQRIERNNLTLRTRIKRLARKTISFSRSVEIHEKVIGSFIEKYMFY